MKYSVLACLLLLVGLLALASFEAKADTYYVREGGTGNGTSWANATGTLQFAIDSSSSGDDIWIASGTYFPTSKFGGTGTRNLCFSFDEDINVFGGFPDSGSPVFGDRNISINSTVLSGDIGSTGTRTDNCYHVIYQGTPCALTLDGLIIRDGYADGASNSGDGGGIWFGGGTITLNYCSVLSNYAIDDGGGIHCWNVSGRWDINYSNLSYNEVGDDGGGGLFYGPDLYMYSSTVSYNTSVGDVAGFALWVSNSGSIVNCSVYENDAGNNCGGFETYDTDSVFVDGCLVHDNTTGGDIAGLYFNECDTLTLQNSLIYDNIATASTGGIAFIIPTNSYTMLNCTIFGNESGINGGGLEVVGSATFVNSIIYGNTAPLNPQIQSQFASEGFSIGYSCVQGGYSGTGAGTGIISSDPLFVNSGSGDFHLSGSSPCINTGSNDAVSGIATDFEGDPRIVGGVVDMGVDETPYVPDPTPPISDWGNLGNLARVLLVTMIAVGLFFVLIFLGSGDILGAAIIGAVCIIISITFMSVGKTLIDVWD